MTKDWKYELIKKFTNPGHAHVHSIRQMNLDHKNIGKLIQFIDSNFLSKEEVIKLVEGKKIGTFKEWYKATKKYGGTKEEWKKLQAHPYDEALDDIIKELKNSIQREEK